MLGFGVVPTRVVCCSCNREVPHGETPCPGCGNRPGVGYFLFLNDHQMALHFPDIEMAEAAGP